MSFMDLLAYNKLVSSAKGCMSEYVTMLCKSLMYIRKSKGPSTEPWGTPMFMGRVSDISLLIAGAGFFQRDMFWITLKVFLLFHSVLAWQEECHDQQYQMPSESQERLHKLFSIIYCLLNFFSDAN